MTYGDKQMQTLHVESLGMVQRKRPCGGFLVQEKDTSSWTMWFAEETRKAYGTST